MRIKVQITRESGGGEPETLEVARLELLEEVRPQPTVPASVPEMPNKRKTAG
jgi:hypothetical protein